MIHALSCDDIKESSETNKKEKKSSILTDDSQTKQILNFKSEECAMT